MDKRESKIPLVRFPEFKEGWEHKQLNELLKVSKKKNTDLKYSKEEVLSVSGELGIVNQIEHLGRSYAGESVHNYGVVENGDIVYTKSPLKENPYGIIKLNKGVPGIVSTLYAVYKLKDNNADGEFIEHYFSLDANTNRYLRPLVRKGAKNDMKINNEYVLHDRIFVPKKEEQKRIAHFFNVIDTKINQLKEKHNLLQEYKKGVMQKIFTQEIRFKKEDGSDFADWVTNKKLKTYAKFYSGGTPRTTNKAFYEGNIPFIKSGEINSDYTEQFISKEGLDNSSAKMVNKGDLLYALYGATSGEVGISKINGAINQAVLCIRSDEFDKNYLLGYLEYFKKSIVGKYLQGGQGNLSADIVKSLKIPKPVIEEQEKISNILTKIDKKIIVVNNEIEDLKTYKKALLQQMFCY
ncbi:restriction endonuclease subunit S [Flagellimonas sp.]|uniref:restriction endonuclease subunit S n=1 Tax=Flagellimonas sp. TaxID=2058762 RepID=UPI003BAA0269